MDNDHDILMHFGGLDSNDLNNTLKLNDDCHDSDKMTFRKSSYIDINNLSSVTFENRLFNILSVNIQCINSKFNSLLGFLQILNESNISIDVLNLQETWLSDSWLSHPDNANVFQIPGYKLISLGKQCCGHGGLFTYVKEDYEVTFRPLYDKSQLFEALFVEITADHLKGKVLIGNIYRPSTNSSDTNIELDRFIKEFQPIVEKLDRENATVAISGDFNINLLLVNQREMYQEYFDLLISKGFLPQATLPTRFSSKSATLIDNIFLKTKGTNIETKSAIILSKLSDYFPLMVGIDITKSKQSNPKYVYTQEKSSKAIHNFISDVGTQFERANFNQNLFNDPNENYNAFEI